MSTKFFTNKAENTLLTKLEGIFQHMSIFYFDAIVGYFRASGYFRIYNHLRNVEKIRFLVGIEVDKLAFEAYSRHLEFRPNHETTKEKYLDSLITDIQSAKYDKEVELGMLQFIDDLISGKIQMKAHPSKKLHAKVYIFRQEHKHAHAGFGAVITGSSNFTEAGLEKNFEFNVELRDADDIDFATETFEELWAEGVAITSENIARAKKKTYLNSAFTPFEIYIKFLLEYFGKSIEYDPDVEQDIPEGYMHLRYQQDAVNDGFRKLRKFNGFFLADVVGLGKTIVACQIAKKFFINNGVRTHILVVHPPALKQNWDKTLNDYNIRNVVDLVSNGSLHKIKRPENYDLIIVDEAHKFRSDTSDMFNNLQKLCKTPRRNPGPDGSRQKKVILVSATPLNNKPEDIRNLILLFQDGRNSNLEISNLISFFRPLIESYNKLKLLPLDEARLEVKRIYDRIRTKVLEPIIIRRTRTDIEAHEEYAKDISSQGVRFPKIEKPEPLYYVLDTNLNLLYEQTIQMLKDPFEGLFYFRYQAISNLKRPYRDKYQKAEDISRRLAFIMKTLLVKRLDSSFHSFVLSLEKYCKANRAMLQMFANNRIHIAPELHVSEYILEDREDELIEKMDLLRETDPSIETYAANAFESNFEPGLVHDQELLDSLLSAWKRWQANNNDPKLVELLNQLQNRLLSKEINDTGKIVLFSEYKDTTNYLKQSLKLAGFDNILTVDSSNVKDLANKIAANFDARLEPAKQENDYDIIITTEVLAEGVNLHRSHFILNYDIPWNATRLMQRIGRVNRIGTTAKKIHIFNFYPTEQTEGEISLKKKAVLKLQAFHSALGEDSQIYSSEEEFGTFGLFDKVPKEERDERLDFLLELRNFRKDNPEWFRQITEMPKRARTGRLQKTQKNTTITYLKNNRRDAFYYSGPKDEVEELTFLECVRLFKAYTSEQGQPLPENHHKQVQLACESFIKSQWEDSVVQKTNMKFGPNEKIALGALSIFARKGDLQEDVKKLIIMGMDAIKAGRFQNLPRDINKLQKAIKNAHLKEIVILEKICEILKKYPLEEITEDDQAPEEKSAETLAAGRRDEPQIIISESFI